MPDEAYWSSFFNTEAALEKLLGSGVLQGNIVEFGCGYGTFTLPTAQRTSGIMTALDIDPQMVDCVRQKAVEKALFNIKTEVRDFVEQGTGLDDGTQSHAMIFNLLHMEQPTLLLRESYRVLRDGGRLSVIHWRSDIPTPRGPSLDIRPRPEQCRAWLEEVGFLDIELVNLQPSCSYHFGLIARR